MRVALTTHEMHIHFKWIYLYYRTRHETCGSRPPVVCTHIIVIWHGYFKTDIVPPGKKPRILTTRPNGVTMMGRVNLNILYKYKNGGYPRGVGYVHVYYSYIRKHVT